MNATQLRETIEHTTADIIGDLINLRAIPHDLPQEQLDFAAIYIGRRLEALLVKTKK